MEIRAAILTISDSCARGERHDLSGDALAEELSKIGARVVAREVLPDDGRKIQERLRHYASREDVNLVVTTGGTGIGPRDCTPEATQAVLEKNLPGLAELMRLEGLKSTPRAALSRAMAGVVQGTLVVNFPGSPRGARESFQAIASLIPHTLEVMGGAGHG